MTDQRGDPTAFYDMGDTSALPLATVNDMPKASALRQFWVSSQYAAANGEEGADDARRQSLIDGGLRDIVAELDHRGITDSRYTAHLARDGWATSYNTDAIWEGIARARAIDKTAFKGIPDTPDDYRREVTAPLDAKMAEERRTLSQSGWTAWGAGQFVGSLSDPINLVGMASGAGEAKTIAQAALRDAAINASLTAAEEPSKIIARAKRGEDTSAGEVATDIAGAGALGALGGAFFKSAEIGGRKVIGRLRSPSADLADDMRSTLGDRMTETEKAATDVLDRTAETEATSPFTPGSGTEHHFVRMDEATARLNDPETPAPEPVPTVDPRAVVKDRIRQVESSGDDNAVPIDPKTGKPLSSAYGRYQFTEDTWKRYYVRRFGRGGLSDAQIAARRSDPALQDQLMDDMLADNARMLARIGARETPGNLYLAHFLGQGGAESVLRATPDTPIEALIGKKAIEANKFLRGKTAGDVIEWASAKMGGDTGAPTLRRDLFDSDEEYAAAQRAVDDDELSRLASRTDTDMLEPYRATAIAPDAEPVATDIMSAGEDVPTQRFYPLPAEEGEPVRLVTNKVVAEQAAPGREIAGIDVPRTHVDELAPPAEDFPTSGQRTMTPELASSLSRPVSVRRMDIHTTESAIAATEQLVQRALPKTGKPGYGVEAPDDASFQSVVLRGKDGRAKAALIVPRDPDVADHVGGAITYVSPEVRSKGVVTRLHNLARDAGITVGREEPRVGTGRRFEETLEGDHASFSESTTPLASPQLQAFDDPFHGAAVAEQTQSLEHDVRMMAIENPDLTVRLTEDGAEERLGVVLDDIDADDEAIRAARACMQPPRA